jgi:hypothetical protein
VEFSSAAISCLLVGSITFAALLIFRSWSLAAALDEAPA